MIECPFCYGIKESSLNIRQCCDCGHLGCFATGNYGCFSASTHDQRICVKCKSKNNINIRYDGVN